MIVLGVRDSAGVHIPGNGLSSGDLSTFPWRYDAVVAGLSSYADPYVQVDVEEQNSQRWEATSS